MMNVSRAARLMIVLGAMMIGIGTSVAQREVTDRVYEPKQQFPGMDYYWRIDATASTGGSLTAPDQAIAELKRRGFKSVINLKGGETAEAEGKAVEAAGMKYFLIPMDAPTTDTRLIDRFLEIVSERANHPVMIHSGAGHRSAALWMIKRVLVDKWTIEKAGQEATIIGLVDNHPAVPGLWQLALDYLRDHGINGIYK